ncbi:MAG: hypothetical protein ACLQJR_20245 [Stellaceae bacterium]
MKIWPAMKRLNQRYDAWARRTATRVVAELDRSGENGRKSETKRYIGVWDLLSKNREPGR